MFWTFKSYSQEPKLKSSSAVCSDYVFCIMGLSTSTILSVSCLIEFVEHTAEGQHYKSAGAETGGA